MALAGIASLGKQQLEEVMLIEAKKKGFIKNIGRLQMVFISEGVLPKALGARKTVQGKTNRVTQA